MHPNSLAFAGAWGQIDPSQFLSRELCMKKYMKPSLKALGLLRVVTQRLSSCVIGAFCEEV